MNEQETWIEALKESIRQGNFVKLTLSKPAGASDLQNVYLKLTTIKEVPMLSFTYRHKTNDIVKNTEVDEGVELVKTLMGEEFRIGTLLTIAGDYTLRISKKGKMELIRTKASLTTVPTRAHDTEKIKRSLPNDPYLYHLGVTDKDGNIIPRMADKYKQINKYLEVMEGLIASSDLTGKITIVDMGAGKGYLTFALYDYLKNKLKRDVQVTGVELRKELVYQCNQIAQQCQFQDLTFASSTIEDFKLDKVDILIALHACDTATDDAIVKGMKANASLIVCAPCCHKQIRQQLKGKELSNPMLKYGIFKERELEMVTDTLRALILEKNNYKSNIFEFISNEHTRKNVMLVGTKVKENTIGSEADQKIASIKEAFQIDYHYLEKQLD